jgi:hypothetical protein
MEVIGGRGATSRPIVQDDPVRTEVSREMKKSVNSAIDSLGSMRDMGYCKMTGDDRHGVRKDEIFVTVEYGFLSIGKVMLTEKAGALINVHFAHQGSGARESAGIVEETY